MMPEIPGWEEADIQTLAVPPAIVPPLYVIIELLRAGINWF